MFRDFAKRKAEKLGLVGTVLNMNDGSVQTIAEGEGPELQKFLEQLKKGPVFAKVERIDAKWLQATGEFRDFRILFYGK